MKTYKIVERKVEDGVYCDVCGNPCSIEQIGNEYATLEAIWGYGSKYDGTKFDIQICEKCFDDTLDWIKKRRKQNLGPFNYPYSKDPLEGERY
jgi:hypothetical protein